MIEPPKEDFENMTIEEIEALFKKYDFSDELGHNLLLCQDFIDLLDYVTSLREK